MIKLIVTFVTLLFIIAIVGGGIYFGTQKPEITQTQKEVEIPYDTLVAPKPPAVAPTPAPIPTEAPTPTSESQQPVTEAPANETPASID